MAFLKPCLDIKGMIIKTIYSEVFEEKLCYFRFVWICFKLVSIKSITISIIYNFFQYMKKISDFLVKYFCSFSF